VQPDHAQLAGYFDVTDRVVHEHPSPRLQLVPVQRASVPPGGRTFEMGCLACWLCPVRCLCGQVKDVLVQMEVNQVAVVGV
jgi:hypothetical protein